MPSPLSFRDRNDLVAVLRTDGWQWKDSLKNDHRDQKELGPLAAVYASVSSSTYRAFRRGRGHSPSVVFRTWAANEILEGALSDLRNIRSNEQYRTWAKNLARNLRKRWKGQLGYFLDLPRALKLVNLLAKGLCAVSPLWPDECDRIVKYVDVPLDKYSLQPLACIPELQNLKLDQASMGSVTTVNDYDEIQDVIRDLCREADVPAIAYDFLMWNANHAKKK